MKHVTSIYTPTILSDLLTSGWSISSPHQIILNMHAYLFFLSSVVYYAAAIHTDSNSGANIGLARAEVNLPVNPIKRTISDDNSYSTVSNFKFSA